MKEGILISIEGPDGAGKSTQLDFIRDYLNNKYVEPVFLREPGSTKLGEMIREVLLSNENSEISYTAEALLYAAARAQIVEEKIVPYLNEGRVVICDRYVDSSFAYQGYGRELGFDLVNDINQYAIKGILPNLTIFLDLDTDSSRKRLTNTGEEADRIESEGLDFHQRVLQGYREVAKRFKDRIISIDANMSIKEVSSTIESALDRIFSYEV